MNQKKQSKEKRKAALITLITAIAASLIIGVIMLLCFQKGLPVTERCSCSWSKLISTMVGVFVGLSLNYVGYLIYWNKGSEKMHGGASYKSDWTRGGNVKMNIITTAIFSFVTFAVIFFLLPVFFDQNSNFLWFAASGVFGIIIMVLYLAASAVPSFLLKAAADTYRY